jgi:hypothetical protein
MTLANRFSQCSTDKGSNQEDIMRFLASFTLANAAQSQRRMREIAERDRQVRRPPRHSRR